MAEKSNLLTARIELSLRAVEQGAKAIQGAVNSINEKTDFNALKNQFATLATSVTKAATDIGTEIKKITDSIDLSQVAVNLQNLDRSVATIMGDIQNHLTKMTDTVKATAQEANKSDFNEVKEQLTTLQKSVENFITLTNSKDFLKGFSGAETQGAVASLREYAKALKDLANIDTTGLTNNLQKLAKTATDSKGKPITASIAGVDMSNSLKQIEQMGFKFADMKKQILGVSKAIDTLATTDMLKFNQVVEKLKIVEFGKGNLESIEKQMKSLRRLLHTVTTYETKNQDGETVTKYQSLNSLEIILDKILQTLIKTQEVIAALPESFKKTGTAAGDVSQDVEKIEKAAESTTSKLTATTDALKDFNKALPTEANLDKMKQFGEATKTAKTAISDLVNTLIKMNKQMVQAGANVEAGGIENMSKAAAEATVETQKAAEAGKQLNAQMGIGSDNKTISQLMSMANSLGQITKGMASVTGAADQMKITIGADIASIASALKSLADGEGLKNLAVALSSAAPKSTDYASTASQIESVQKAYNNLESAITQVGNAMAKMLVGSNLEDVRKGAGDDVINKYNNIKASIEGAKSSMEEFTRFDMADENSGIANFVEEMNKLGNLITRIFTTYTNYSAATSDFGVDIGASDFAEHLRTVSTQAQNSTANIVNMVPVVGELKAVFGQFGTACQTAAQQMGQMAQASNAEMLSKMADSFAQLQGSIAGLTQMNATAQALSTLSETIAGIKTSLSGFAESTKNVQMSAEGLQALKDALSGLAQNSMVEQLRQSVEGLAAAMKEIKIPDVQGIQNILAQMQGIIPDAQQLQTVIEGISVVSSNLVEGLFQLDQNGNPIQPFLSSLQGFDAAALEQQFTAITAQVSSLILRLDDVARAIDGVSASINRIDAEKLNQLTGSGAIRLDTEQFTALTNAIQAGTNAVREFMESVQNMSPQQFEQMAHSAEETAIAVSEAARTAHTIGASGGDATATATATASGQAVSLDALVAAYKELYQVQIQLTRLGESDTNQRTELEAKRQALQSLVDEYKALHPEMAQYAEELKTTVEAKEKLRLAEAKQQDKSNAAQLKKTQQEYNSLLKEQYENQKRIHTTEKRLASASSEEQRISLAGALNALKQEEMALEDKINALEAAGVENPQLKAKYQRQLNDLKAREQSQTKASAATERNITDTIMQRLKMYIVYRGLRKMWTEATDAAQEYYDLLNEIQIVMQNSDGEIEAMSQQFQKMAKDLQISATDIATSAVEFVRQGLSESETMERTEWASMYAKVTSQEFDEASEQITATVNSMGVSAQEAVDLFVYLGDNSATSGAEVAEAFQKASAAAASFGLDINHLGAWIATVSAKTRTEASSIGTSFNSILARWHSIKSTGYSEDEDGDVVGVNDITKALGTNKVNISLFDEMGEWRDMADVLDELAGKWNTLDSITQSYIATTMAGTRQQNVFLALMEDLAQGAEGGSIAYKLYEGSLSAAGTVTQKYQTYLESVTAAQDKMTVSLENLYSTFMNGDLMKDFYNTVSELIDNVTAGLPAINTKLLAIIAAGGTLAIVIAKIVKAIREIRTAVSGLSGAAKIGGILSSGKLGIILAGVGVLATAITAVVGAVKNARDEARNVDYSGQISSLRDIVSNVEPLIEEYTVLSNKTIRTQEETERMNELFLEIGTTSDIFAAAMNKVSGDTSSATDKINAMNEALAETKQLLTIVEGSEKAYSLAHATDNYSGLTASQDAYEEVLGFGAEPFTEELYGSKEAAAKAWWDSIVKKHHDTQDLFGNSDAKSYIEDVMGIDLGSFSMEGFKGDYGALKHASQLNKKELERLIGIWETYQSSIKTVSSMTAMNQEIENTLTDDIQAVMDGLVETAKKEDVSSTIAQMTEAQIEGARDAMIATIQKRALTEDISTVIAEESAKATQYLTEAANNSNYDLEYMEKYLTSWLGSEEDWSQTAQELVKKGITTSMIDLARTNWKSIGVDWVGETLAQNMFGNVKMSDITNRMLAGGYLKNKGWSGDGSRNRRFASTSYNIGSQANWGKGTINFDYGQDAVIEVTPVTPNGDVLTPDELNDYIGNIVEKAKQNQTSILDEDSKGLILSVLPVDGGDFTGTLETSGVGEKIAAAASAYMQAGGGLEYFVSQGQTVETMLDDVASDFMAATGYTESYEERVNSLKDSMLGFGISTENVITLFQKMTSLMKSSKLSWDEIWTQYSAAESGENGFSGFVKWMQDTIQTLTGEDISETAKGWSDILTSFVNNEDLDNEDSLNLIAQLLPQLQGVAEGAEVSAESLLNFSAAYNELTKTNRKTIKGMLDISDDLWDSLTNGTELSADEAKDLAKALERLQKELKLNDAEDSGDILEGVADAFTAAKKNAKTFNKEMTDVVSTVETARNAQLAYQYVMVNGSSADYYEDAMSDLESYTGLSASAIAGNMDYVSQIVAADMNQAANSVLGLCNAIGVLSNSNISINDAGLLALQGTTDATTGHVVTLINTLLDAAGYKLMTVLNKDAGTAELRVVSNGSGASYTPKSGSSSGGGGGGGGGGGSDSGNNGNTEEERWVEEIENRLQRISDRMSQLSTIMDSWDSEGYYTAEIKALKQTNDMLEEQDKILEEKIAEAKERLKPLIEEFNATEPDTEAYDAILERVNTIQDAITDWTQELTENESSLVSNRQKVDELKDSIRELHLDLEEEILSAIEDREDRIDEMLQARIEMEETILEILKAQAEDAEQAILDALDAQIDALEKERDAVSELLDARKEQAEEEDKLTELQQLQAKYARIIADPTRAKDAADILKDIRDLQDEIAWSQAENENEAQQDSLDQQIDSLEDYRDYIEQYYEDLLDNPRNFIDQVDAILKMSQEDILTWLMQNSDDYKNATDATREDTVNGWTETLNEMNGVVETHWAEVQALINEGQDAVIAFLKENSADYREASKLQQEAYVDGWVDMFDSITKAYQDMEATLLDNSSFINNSEWGGSGDNSSSGGGGGGGSSGSSGNSGKKWAWSLDGSQVGTKTYDTREEAQEALDKSVAYAKTLMDNARANMMKNGASGQAEFERLRDAYNIQKKATVAQFAKGGIADYTGLIQIDGTKVNPERILSGTQTKLFDTLVKSLEQMSRVSVSPMRYNGEISAGKTAAGYTFGDINISVDRLDSDRDIEDLADKVKDAIVESMTKGRAIGGITL